MKKGLLIVVSAPSGCGKGTILGEILKEPNYYYSVSATTRQPREGEEDGVHYRFLQREQFEALIKDGAFIEHAEYCQNYSGTLQAPIEENRALGRNVILEIEVQGAMQIKEKCPEAVFIFIAPPSVGELRRRLLKRGTETEEVIEKRVSEAAYEIGFAKQYDYIVVNGALEDAIDDFKTVIRAHKLKAENQNKLIDEVLENA